MSDTKNFYFLALKKNGNRCRAEIMKVTPSNNILTRYTLLQGITVIRPCETKKEAEELCEKWNQSYMKYGTYLCD